MLDILIRGARILDGTATPFYRANVGIRDGKIVSVDKTDHPARRVVDAGGLTLSPGFIDSHSHSDTVLDAWPDSAYKLEQGITTEIAGTCGISPAPLSPAFLEDGLRTCSRHDGMMAPELRYRFSSFLDQMDKPMGPNVAFQVGHGTLRAAVCGYANRPVTPAELEQMKALLTDAMEHGAAGISFGLIYPPGSYADEAELIELLHIVVRYGGFFSIHMRSEGPRLVESVESVIRMVKATGIRAVISHHKASRKPNWGKPEQTLALIDKATGEGWEIFLDQYPYIASSTGLNTILPDHMHALGVSRLVEMLSTPEGRAEITREVETDRGVAPGGDVSATLDYVMIGSSNAHPEYAGKMLCDLAAQKQTDAFQLLMDILRDDGLSTGAIYFTMCEEDVRRIMAHPRTMVGTDGLYHPGAVTAHPRAFGTFPRFLGRYVREQGVVSMPEAIRKITAMPAAVYGLTSKGLIRPGFDADLVLFDADTIMDRADFSNFNRPNTGIETVYIAGRPVVEKGKYNGALQGGLLRRR